ncbi:hypothetical protein CDD82_5538 [Ophiocordyceps australis]|uniref:Peptidase M60 domain-containing protein n=1 Tax=Ophiocordyceps australis TaxID=1399860 RepID=A0A2C5Z1T0_9HYPO|nr:hypothetical protein CDD82_5538 [Ophiocordyceps australis]
MRFAVFAVGIPLVVGVPWDVVSGKQRAVKEVKRWIFAPGNANGMNFVWSTDDLKPKAGSAGQDSVKGKPVVEAPPAAPPAAAPAAPPQNPQPVARPTPALLAKPIEEAPPVSGPKPVVEGPPAVPGDGERLGQGQESKFAHPRTIKVAALPNNEDERQRLNQNLVWADFHPTGFYVGARQVLKVKVSGVRDNGPQPEILVGTPNLIDPARPFQDMRAMLVPSGPLGNGDHDVENDVDGIIYIRYVYGRDQEAPPPVSVTLEGDAAQPIPLFRQGVTTDEEWVDMLRETKVPFAEHVGERVILTGLKRDALVYAERGQKQEELLNRYKAIIAAQDAISGLRADAADARDRPSPLRPMVVQTNRMVYANAWSWRAAIGQSTISDIWWQPELERSWKIWHELGHHRQHSPTWSWEAVAEVTVNIYTLAARRLVPEIPSSETEHGTVEEWNKAKRYLEQGRQFKDFDRADLIVMLVMFEQLREVFGDGFYHELHRRSRAEPVQYEGEADKKHHFMALAANVTGHDLTPFFETWGLRPEGRTVEEMARQPQKMGWDFSQQPVFGGE